MRLAFLLPATLLIGCASTAADRPMSAADQAGLAKALAGRIAGPPTSCVPIAYRALNTRTFGRTILYQEGAGTIYRNDTAGGCEAAARGDILVQVELEGRPCSGDIIRTIEPIGRTTSGSCALGQFVPYTRPRTAR